MGILCCVYCYGAKLGLRTFIAYKLCLFCGYNVVKMNWYDLEYALGLSCSGCVREIVLESAILTQASQASLGEICRDSHPFPARGYRSGERFLVWAKGHLA